jgi:hypothetical protein
MKAADGANNIEFIGPSDHAMWHSRRFWNGGSRPETIGRIWLTHPDRRQYRGIVFAPEGAPDEFYNLWRGFDVRPRSGDPFKAFPTFLDHIRTNVAGGDGELDRWIWAWFAHMLQRPTERIGVALVLRGKMGVGKTKIGEVIGSLFSRHYLLVDDPRYITGQFNAHLANCLLLQADEGFWAGDKQAEGRLKGLVTSRQHMIERKGVDPVPVRNLIRLLVTSNNHWVVPAGMEERRFAVVDLGEAAMQNAKYFAAIDDEMANGGREALLDYLLRFDLSKVDLRRLPRTSSLYEQKVASLPTEAAWWLDRLRHGSPTSQSDYWAGEAPRDAMYGSYVAFAERLGQRRKLTPDQFGIELRKLLPPDSLKASRPRVTVADEATGDTRVMRVRYYRLPSLEVCRGHFAGLLRSSIDWECDDDG